MRLKKARRDCLHARVTGRLSTYNSLAWRRARRVPSSALWLSRFAILLLIHTGISYMYIVILCALTAALGRHGLRCREPGRLPGRHLRLEQIEMKNRVGHRNQQAPAIIPTGAHSRGSPRPGEGVDGTMAIGSGDGGHRDPEPRATTAILLPGAAGPATACGRNR